MKTIACVRFIKHRKAYDQLTSPLYWSVENIDSKWEWLLAVFHLVCYWNVVLFLTYFSDVLLVFGHWLLWKAQHLIKFIKIVGRNYIGNIFKMHSYYLQIRWSTFTPTNSNDYLVVYLALQQFIKKVTGEDRNNGFYQWTNTNLSYIYMYVYTWIITESIMSFSNKALKERH